MHTYWTTSGYNSTGIHHSSYDAMPQYRNLSKTTSNGAPAILAHSSLIPHPEHIVLQSNVHAAGSPRIRSTSPPASFRQLRTNADQDPSLCGVKGYLIYHGTDPYIHSTTLICTVDVQCNLYPSGERAISPPYYSTPSPGPQTAI